MYFLMPHMFDITKLGGNSARTNRPNLQCYGACHHGHPTRDICVRICETAHGYEGCAILRSHVRGAFRRKLSHGSSPRRGAARLGEPMRGACRDLSVTNLQGGHWLPLERKGEVVEAMRSWLKSKGLS
jgi:hypothetical protein